MCCYWSNCYFIQVLQFCMTDTYILWILLYPLCVSVFFSVCIGHQLFLSTHEVLLVDERQQPFLRREKCTSFYLSTFYSSFWMTDLWISIKIPDLCLLCWNLIQCVSEWWWNWNQSASLEGNSLIVYKNKSTGKAKLTGNEWD